MDTDPNRQSTGALEPTRLVSGSSVLRQGRKVRSSQSDAFTASDVMLFLSSAGTSAIIAERDESLGALVAEAVSAAMWVLCSGDLWCFFGPPLAFRRVRTLV